MALLSRASLLLLAALALALVASPAAGASPGKRQLVGGLSEADVNEQGVQQALDFALSEYNKASNDAFHSRALRVVRARKQVRPPGRGGRGGGVGAGAGAGAGARAARAGAAGSPQGRGSTPGGRGPRDVSSPAPAVPQLSGVVTREPLAPESWSPCVQVVAGLNYFLDVEIGRTRCTKSQPNLASCPFHDPLRKTLCSFQIYTVPWMGTMSVVKSSCQDA
ncbi:hypothetical protein HPG69_008662 [Diceros bicornis minor]|uniref:Cystatin domain-containing protein n=1 Tax=Diceros bicornis minor TaxID=77932 RepID=A0A7J7FAL6_DICBM|nr:hypothetical protein HPG69_008662 [Diceros bicornis minor]